MARWLFLTDHRLYAKREFEKVVDGYAVIRHNLFLIEYKLYSLLPLSPSRC